MLPKIFEIDAQKAIQRIGMAALPAAAGAVYAETGGRLARGFSSAVDAWAAKSSMNNSHVEFASGLAINAAAYKFAYQKKWKKKEDAQNFALLAGLGSAGWAYAPTLQKYVDVGATKLAALIPSAKPKAITAGPQQRTLAPQLEVVAMGGPSYAPGAEPRDNGDL